MAKWAYENQMQAHCGIRIKYFRFNNSYELHCGGGEISPNRSVKMHSCIDIVRYSFRSDEIENKLWFFLVINYNSPPTGKKSKPNNRNIWSNCSSTNWIERFSGMQSKRIHSEANPYGPICRNHMEFLVCICTFFALTNKMKPIEYLSQSNK